MSVALMGVVAAVLFGALITLGVHAGYPWIRPWLGRLPAHLRARFVFALLAAPAIIGAALSLLAVLPGIAASLSPALDHCTHHDDHHFHLCVVHGPTGVQFGRAWLVLGVIMTPVAIRFAAAMARVLRGRRLLAALRRSARPSRGGYHEVGSDAPFAVTAGLLRPRVYVTTALLRDLDPSSQAAVLAHEAAHVRRRDPLTKLLAELLGALHPTKTRHALVADLSLSCEQACDEEAAAAVGDRTVVADALLRVGRLVSDAWLPPSPVVSRFGEGNITARVHALVQAPKAPPRLPSAAWTGAAAILLAVALSAPLHHVTETVLGTLFG